MTAWRSRLVGVALVVLAAGVLSAGEIGEEATSQTAAQAPTAALADRSFEATAPAEALGGGCTPGPGPACFQCCYKNYKACLAAGGDPQDCADAYLQCRNDCIP